MSESRDFGPMHGERTRRHQTNTESDDTILSVYEAQVNEKPCLIVETTTYQPPYYAALNVEQVRALREWCAEFLDAWWEYADDA